MAVFLICVVFAAVAFQQYSKPYFAAKKAWKTWNEDKVESYSVLDLSKNSSLVYLVVVVLAFAAGVYLVVAQRQWEMFMNGMGVAVIVVAIGIAKWMATKEFHKVSYNEEHFVYIDQQYRMKSYKGVVPVPRKFGKYEIQMYSGKSVVVPKDLALAFDATVKKGKK